MAVDMSEWKARKKLKHSLLRRAFNENRGAEVILLIQWRTAQERHRSAPYAAQARAFLDENEGQPRAIRALNLVAAEKGIKERYHIAPERRSAVEFMAAIYNQPSETQIRIQEPRKLYGTPEDFGIRPKPRQKELWEINWSNAAYEVNTAITCPSYKN